MKFEKIMIDHENYMPMDENQLQSDKINRSTTATTDWSNIWFISLEKQFILMVLTWQGIQLQQYHWLTAINCMTFSESTPNDINLQWQPSPPQERFHFEIHSQKQKLKYSVVVLSNIFSGSVPEIWSLVSSKIKNK